MAQHFLKNIDYQKALLLESLVEFQTGLVVSRTFAQEKNLSLSLFAFDQGEELNHHRLKNQGIQTRRQH